MSQRITTITLDLPLRMGTVNCYLVRTKSSFALIDSGPSSNRRDLVGALKDAGCGPDNLKLIVLTHGDFDHTGNAAYLRDQSDAVIAMGLDDLGMAEEGDMFWNRSSGNAVLKVVAPVLFRFGKAQRFSPDVELEDGLNLSNYGLDAWALSLPGHSRGSFGIITPDGDLFCGDLLENVDEPAMNSIMDDAVAYEESMERLRGLAIGMVYPGHGKPFRMEDLPAYNQ